MNFDEDYWDDEAAEELAVLDRAKKMGIPDSSELRKYIASKDSFSIRDEELLKFLDEDSFNE